MNATLIAIAVVSDGEWYLVGERPEGVELAGFAEFPGGKVQPGEDPAKAAERECSEETGVAVEVGPLLEQVDFEYPQGPVRLQFFACHPRPPLALPKSPYRWVHREQLASLDFPPANERVLLRLAKDVSAAEPPAEPTS